MFEIKNKEKRKLSLSGASSEPIISAESKRDPRLIATQSPRMTEKALSFLRLRGASGVQGISAPASCRKAHKRRFILNQWILHFANAQPLKMTALAFLLSLNLSTAFAGTTCTKDGTKLIISGSGTFDGCSDGSQRTATEVTIGTGVTRIGKYAFAGAKNLTSITIPEGVTSIGNWAFQNASSLKSITIPDSVKSIGYDAFFGASSLESIKIPEGVTSIEDNAFNGASSLTSITIPNSVTSIGHNAFLNTSSLESITIPDSVTSIGVAAFHSASSLTSITIPDSVTSIGANAFYGASSLESIIIPNDINTADWDAMLFYGLPDKTKIVCQGGLNTCYEKLAKYFSYGDCPQNLIVAGKGKMCSCSDSRFCILPSRISEATNSSQDSSNQDKETVSGDFNPADCYNNGQVPYNNQCLDEYPFAKKRWTPAEANEWLHDGNDNFVVITFKK